MPPGDTSGDVPTTETGETGAVEHGDAVELRADGRTLSGHAVRYGDLRRDGREKFAPGAFAADRVTEPLRLNIGHDRAEAALVPLPVEMRAEGPYIETTLPAGKTADRVARGDLGGLSVGFVALTEHRDAAGVRVIDRAHLDHIALVARPAYATATVELRGSYLARMSAKAPTGRRLGCRCAGKDCDTAEVEPDGWRKALAEAGAAGSLEVRDDFAGDIIAVFSRYQSAFASCSRGTLRLGIDNDGALTMTADIPDSEVGRALLSAHRDAGVIVRPRIDDPTGDRSRIETRGGQRVRVWSHPRLLAVVVGSTDDTRGWPEPSIHVEQNPDDVARRLL